jgi:hypothetical protein
MKLPVKLKPNQHPSKWQAFPLEISKVRERSHRSCPGPFDPNGANPTRPGFNFGVGVATANIPLEIWKIRGDTPQVPFFFNSGNEITGKTQTGSTPFRVANFPPWNFKNPRGIPQILPGAIRPRRDKSIAARLQFRFGYHNHKRSPWNLENPKRDPTNALFFQFWQ